MRKDVSDTGETAGAANAPLPGRPIQVLLYAFFLSLYYLAIRIFSLFNAKAGKWITGRKDWQQNMKLCLRPNEIRVWLHCSSVGEFEQATPLAEALKKEYPAYKIVLTFFSPSGYEAIPKNSVADYIFYLPPDSSRNAEEFIALIGPALAVFVKYEFWYFYLCQLKKQGIPTILVSGAFRQEQPFFKWYGGLFRDMLTCFSFFFLQDEESKDALGKIGLEKNVMVSGDTRYDRVSIIAGNAGTIPGIEQFKGGNKILIAGSTWPGDEAVLKDCIGELPGNWKVIIAPHETDEAHVRKIQKLFGDETILYSELNDVVTGADKRILIINNIGMLSRLFACGDVAYIGGGFHKEGIHNILEPAVFGLPVIFGPVYEKFVEAKKLASLHIVFPVSNVKECKTVLKKLVDNETFRNSVGSSLKAFMQHNTGATDVVIKRIKEEEWL